MKTILLGSGQEHCCKTYINGGGISPTIGCTDLSHPRMIEVYEISNQYRCAR